MSSNGKNGDVTASDLMAVAEDGGVSVTAGSIVWWRLTGGLDLETLRAAWIARGLSPQWLPEPPTLPTALRRAVQELKDTGRIVHGTKNGGWVVTDMMFNKDATIISPRYDVALSCILDKVGRLSFQDVALSSLRTQVVEAFEKHQESLIQADVSPWLCRVMDKVEAVPLRDTGGVYFVPAYAQPLWLRVKAALRECTTHTLSDVPAMRTSEAASAILDAVAREAESTMERFRADMPKLQERGLQNRIDSTLETRRKLESYERLFGKRLDNVREKLDGLRAELTVALVQSQATDGVSFEEV